MTTELNETVDLKEKQSSSIDDVLENEPVYVPYVNIYETSDNFVMIANMPGVSKENLKLKFEDGSLSIFGKINYEEAADKNYILNEIGLGNYYRKFKISDSINQEKIEAKYDNGQLIVTLPKHERVKPRSININ